MLVVNDPFGVANRHWRGVKSKRAAPEGGGPLVVALSCYGSVVLQAL
jgi:hypothetical protein